MRRREDLSTPDLGGGRRLELPRPSPDAVGRMAERIARFFGTTTYLLVQTMLVVIWITFNVLQVTHTLRFDPYPFILLNLAFSTQAAYAAPLILLAQNRQEERDRQQVEMDRATAHRTQADTEYLARELASIRIALADVATNEDLERVAERVAELVTGTAGKKQKKQKVRVEDPQVAQPDSEPEPRPVPAPPAVDDPRPNGDGLEASTTADPEPGPEPSGEGRVTS